MKKLIYTLLILFVYGELVFGQFTPRVSNVELKPGEGTLCVSFDLELPRRMVRSSESLILSPLLLSDKDKLKLPSVAVHGKNRAKVLSRIRRLSEGKAENEIFLQEMSLTSGSNPLISYRLELPLAVETTDDRQLILEGLVRGCKGEREFFRLPLTERISVPDKLKKEPVRTNLRVAFVIPELTVKERQETGRAYLDFPSGGSQILPHYRNNPVELSRIRESVERTYRDKDITIRGIYLTGYASPESSYAFNQQLATDRAQNLKNYMHREYGLPEFLMHVLPGGEDWEGLRELVGDSYLWQKEEILYVIDGYGDADWKEQRLKSMGPAWQQMMEEFFPRLRRVEYRIEYQVRDYNLHESALLLESDPGRLSPYELYRLAGLYPQGSKNWNKLILLTATLYPEDETAAINALAVRLSEGKWQEGKVHQEILVDSKQAEALNNRGVYLFRQGNKEEAGRCFKEAAHTGLTEAIFNLQEITQEIEVKE